MGKGKVLAKTWFVHEAINCLHQRASLSLNSIQTTLFPRYTCNQLLLNHPLNPATLAPPRSLTSPHLKVSQLQTRIRRVTKPPSLERVALTPPKVKKQKTKMTSRIPNPSAPRLSTAPSSIKPRQLVRHLLFSLHSSSLSISATPPPLHSQHLPSPPFPKTRTEAKKTAHDRRTVAPPRPTRIPVRQSRRSRESLADDERTSRECERIGGLAWGIVCALFISASSHLLCL